MGNEISKTWWSVEDTVKKAVRKDTQVPVLAVRDGIEGELLLEDWLDSWSR